MLGRREDQQEFMPVMRDLNSRIPAEHEFRKLLKQIDFSFVIDEVKGFYGSKGNRSEDPVVLIKLMFLLFWDDIKSERELIKQLNYRLDYLFFLGLNENDKIPHHSVLSKARSRWGVEVFERLFTRTVQQAVCAGLVDASKLHIDGSLIDANASNDAWVKGDQEWIEHLKDVYRKEDQKLDEQRAEQGDHQQHPPTGPRGPCSSDKELDLLSKQSLDSAANSKRINSTDIDASFTGKGKGKDAYKRARYKTHRSVDDKHGIITASITTTGCVAENKCLFDLLEQSKRLTAVPVKELSADSQYGTHHILARCVQEGIKAFIKPVERSARTKRIGREHFSYNIEAGTYCCPMGHEMRVAWFDWTNHSYKYRCCNQHCGSCKLAQQCLGNEKVRVLSRPFEQDCLDQISISELDYRSASRRRMSKVERSFADAANNHHLKRARWRRLWRQRIQNYLIAAIQNIKIILKNKYRSPKEPKALWGTLFEHFCLFNAQVKPS